MGFVSSDGLCGVWWSDVAKVYFTDTDGRYPIYLLQQILNTSFITYSNYRKFKRPRDILLKLWWREVHCREVKWAACLRILVNKNSSINCTITTMTMAAVAANYVAADNLNANTTMPKTRSPVVRSKAKRQRRRRAHNQPANQN